MGAPVNPSPMRRITREVRREWLAGWLSWWLGGALTMSMYSFPP
jgi:hypothetical protein